jgi:hypothetical protein
LGDQVALGGVPFDDDVGDGDTKVVGVEEEVVEDTGELVGV